MDEATRIDVSIEATVVNGQEQIRVSITSAWKEAMSLRDAEQLIALVKRTEAALKDAFPDAGVQTLMSDARCLATA